MAKAIDGIITEFNNELPEDPIQWEMRCEVCGGIFVTGVENQRRCILHFKREMEIE